ncbi:MAG: AraC family transcriptional regulator [Lachnospiraceae bacterium]|nr:AraC family transcriptional regulator [Lachnospiraceae bacterium]
MSCKGFKKYSAINGDVQCEIKSKDAPFDYSDDMHNHDCHEILILLGGEIRLYTEYTGHMMKRGDVCFISQYIFHTADLFTPEKYDRIVINVNDDVLKAASSSKMDLRTCFEIDDETLLPTVHLEEDELEEVIGYARELQKSVNTAAPGSEILTDAYLKLIMVKLTEKYSDDPMIHCPNILPPIVSKTFEYIEKHLTEELSLTSLEKEIHHNGTYISRSVKKISGLSLQQYIIAKRLALSCRLLREGYTPSDACFMSGFNNYSNFSRTFSKQIGISPKQLQMSYRNGKSVTFGVKKEDRDRT